MNLPDFSQLIALVVDDNPQLRDFIRTYLTMMGFKKVRTARDGSQAIELLKEENFGLIMSDGVMPGIDGVTLLTLIRTSARTKNIPFIMVSAYPEKTAAEALSNDVTDFIVKPFTFEVFKQKVTAAIAKSQRIS